MIDLTIQNPEGFTSVPSDEDCQCWVEAALQTKLEPVTMVIRFVGEKEAIDLNHNYRNKNSATNVLSFPFEADDILFDIPELADEPKHLGDLVLCESVVVKEACEQKKTTRQHWAHLIIHGALHLQGYDHIHDDEANIMEALEINTLKNLGFENPYLLDINA